MMEVKRLLGLATQWLLARVLRYDLMLLTIVMCLITVGFITLFSAGYSFPWRIEDQMRNIIVALTAMFIVSFVPIRWVRKVSVAAFAAGCLLLLATELVGVTVKGATRWLDIGVRIQPSEIMKLAVPMMLAWYYWKRAEQTVWWDHLLALAILSVPVAFILKQPDLGTAILVSIAGLAVIFFAGINAKLVTACCAIGIALMPLLWTMLHDYQRERILTLIDPTLDPLGKGFHTLQALIAIGSGGFPVKGGWREHKPILTSSLNAHPTLFLRFSAKSLVSLVGCFCSSYISVSLPEAFTSPLMHDLATLDFWQLPLVSFSLLIPSSTSAW